MRQWLWIWLWVVVSLLSCETNSPYDPFDVQKGNVEVKEAYTNVNGMR